jgi:hypothetical protein
MWFCILLIRTNLWSMKCFLLIIIHIILIHLYQPVLHRLRTSLLLEYLFLRCDIRLINHPPLSHHRLHLSTLILHLSLPPPIILLTHFYLLWIDNRLFFILLLHIPWASRGRKHYFGGGVSPSTIWRPSCICLITKHLLLILQNPNFRKIVRSLSYRLLRHHI